MTHLHPYIRKKQDRGYNLMVSSLQQHILFGDGCWWLVDLLKKTQAPYKDLGSLLSVYEGRNRYRLRDMKKLSLHPELVDELGTGGTLWVSSENPSEGVVRLQNPLQGYRWCLLSSEGAILFCQSERDALQTLHSYQWRRSQAVIQEPLSPYWFAN